MRNQCTLTTSTHHSLSADPVDGGPTSDCLVIVRWWRATAGSDEVLDLASFDLKVEYFETVVATGQLAH